MTRSCGGCTLCCRLLPVREGVRIEGWRPPGLVETVSLDKDAGVRCPHQCSKGCAIYDKRPFGCRAWTCRWLTGNDTAGLRRPDRSRYVIDTMQDFVTLTEEGAAPAHVPVVQVWVDPQARDAWREPAMRDYLMRRGAEGVAALIRYNAFEALVVIPPTMTDTGQWIEHGDGKLDPRSYRERLAAAAEQQRQDEPG